MRPQRVCDGKQIRHGVKSQVPSAQSPILKPNREKTLLEGSDENITLDYIYSYNSGGKKLDQIRQIIKTA